jgi:Zn-dependent protease with chaperone function
VTLAKSARSHAIRAMGLAWITLSVVLGLMLGLPYGLFSLFVWFEGFVVIPVAMVLAAVAVATIPLKRIGTAIDADLRGFHADGRLRNVAGEISVAIGVQPRSVMVHPATHANVGAFPTSDGVVVMVTTGAIDQLRRDELEALIAAQFAGISDRWCRMATRAEIAWTFTKVAAFASVFFAAPIGVFVGAFMLMGPRTIEAARDLCADVAAVRATRHPEALASAIRRLAPEADRSNEQKLGIRRFLPVNPFLVIPKRIKSTSTMQVGSGPERTWTEAEELAAELALRADRATALAAGADPRKYTGREFRKRWSQLGV